jgi:phenol hydroxylase P4 protein
MSVRAIRDDYRAVPRDLEANFHGNRLVFIGWDRHLMFCAPVAFPLSPQMSFRDLRDEVLPAAFGAHPDFARIDWERAEWLLDGVPFVPDLDGSLEDNGVGHKSVLRLGTPGLEGLQGSGS